MTIGDETGTYKVTLWEEYIDSLWENCSKSRGVFPDQVIAKKKLLVSIHS